MCEVLIFPAALCRGENEDSGHLAFGMAWHGKHSTAYMLQWAFGMLASIWVHTTPHGCQTHFTPLSLFLLEEDLGEMLSLAFFVVWKMAQEKKHSATHPRSWDSNHILKQTRQCELAAWQKTDNYISCFSLFEDDGLVGEVEGVFAVGKEEGVRGILELLYECLTPASQSKETMCNEEMYVLTANALQRNLPLLAIYAGHNSPILFFAQINQDGNTYKFAQSCRRNCWFETQSGVSPPSEWDTVFWDRRKPGCLQQTICQLVRLVSSLQCISLS